MPRDQEFIERLAELSYDPFFVVDRERRIVYHNAQFALMLELSAARRRKIVGTQFHDLLLFDATGESCIRRSLESDSNIRVQSVTATGPGNRKMVFDMSACPIRDDAGQVTGVLVLQREVTDEQRLKERYNQVKRDHLAERESLLRIISDRDAEIKKLKRR